MSETIRREDWPTVPGFTLTAEIGSGGYGIVFDAVEDSPLALRRAVKVLYPSPFTNPERALARFVREIKILAALSNPHIVKYEHCGFTEDRRPFVVMGFVEGDNLAKRRGSFTALAASEIVAGILTALEAAHAQSVVHRDVKPSNVMMAGEVPVLLDFGICHALEEHDAKERITRATNGTPGYVSPEAERDPLYVSPLNDLFSAGVTLYELIAGVLPLKGNYQSLVPSHGGQGVDYDLDAILKKALSLEAQRFQSADAFRTAVAEWTTRAKQLQQMKGSFSAMTARYRTKAIERIAKQEEAQAKQKAKDDHLRTLVNSAGQAIETVAREAFAEAVNTWGDLDGGWEFQERDELTPPIQKLAGKPEGVVIDFGLRNKKHTDTFVVFETRPLTDKVREEALSTGAGHTSPLPGAPEMVLTHCCAISLYARGNSLNPIVIGSFIFGHRRVLDVREVTELAIVVLWLRSARMSFVSSTYPLPRNEAHFVVDGTEKLFKAIFEMIEEGTGQNIHSYNTR